MIGQDNTVTVFAQCPAGGWHLVCEARYISLPFEVNVYISESVTAFSLGLHPAHSFIIDPRKFRGIDVDPLNAMLNCIPFSMKFAEHQEKNLNTLVADVSKYKDMQP